MNSKKKNNLEETYERIINVGLCIAPYEDLSGLVAPEPMLFGTTKDEKVFSFRELDAMFKSQYEQMAGFVPSLDRKRLFTRFSNDGNNAFITEEVTLTITSPEVVNTILIRCSCVMEYIDNQWKLTHWHASTPVETENDHWHMEEWKREKEKLQQLVDQQTADLQVKNRELEIEASIERVRAVAMGMTKPEDMLKVCRVISDQLQQFGVEHIRNVQTAIINEEKGTYHNYQYFTPYDKESFEITECDKNPVVQAMINSMLESPDAFFTTQITGEELATFRAYRKKENQFPDPLLDDTESVDGNFFSIGPGGLGITLYRPLNQEGLEIFKRFHNVFSLAYRRFRDIEKAVAQAREVQIELALERVRARTMAMKSSDELKEVVAGMFDGLKGLGVDPTVCNIVLIDKKTCDSDVWSAHQTTNGLTTYRVYISHFEHPFRKKLIDAFLNKIPFSVHELSGGLKKSYIQYLIEHVDYSEAPEVVTSSNKELVNIDEGIVLSAAYMKFGLLIVSRNGAVSNDESGILQRFAKIFEQTYTRFLDLQKAEAQARESEIQLALERVRARTMAMQNSEELADVASVLFEQIRTLGGHLWGTGFGLCEKDSEKDSFWFANENGVFPAVSIPNTADSAHIKMYEGWKNKTALLSLEGGGQDLKNHYNYMMTLPEVRPFFQKILDEGLSFPEWQQWNAAYFSHGYLLIITLKPYPDPEILKRFARVFDQTYTRFLDLKKAEAQAREAQIEAALERVRSRSLAMHKTDELQDVVRVVAEELKNTGVILDTGGAVICTYYQDSKDVIHWTATEDPAHPSVPYLLPYFEDELFDEAWESKSRGDDYFAKVFSYDVKNAFFSHAFEHSDYRQLPDEYKKIILESSSHGLAWAWAENSAIMIPSIQGDLPSEDNKQILIRFSRVFEQSFIRFLDLKKAETRAREAQIEVALEKVRSRTMGMQSSDELPEVANLLFLEIQALGIPAWSCGYNILEEKEDKKSATGWMSSEGVLQEPFRLRLWGETSFDEMGDFLRSDETMLVQELGGKALQEHYEHMKSFPDLQPTFEHIEANGLSLPTYQINHLCKFNHGFLLFITYEPVPDAHEIFKRFTNVFDQTYTRFLDLKKAEAQAIEATKQASLDRVRGEIASMRSAKDLEIITPLFWRELTTLGIPFIRCGVFIVHEVEQQVEVYLSKPDGTSLAVMHLPFGASDLAIQTVDAWRNGHANTLHWTRQDFLNWGRTMVEQGQIPDLETYQGAEDAPESLHLHFIPFNQGMLYVGATEPLSNGETGLAASLAEAFSIAYARYEDFVKLEKAKAGIEEALAELKATQSQLVQQEKLASLGQLTAGIAHEIKNPLNFVNNFSDVSLEMIDEALEELQQIGDNEHATETAAILADIKSNLAKIHEHGSRADGIVKSMLMHSRGGSGKMEPTNLNELVKEYVNLSYHGMRAGKNPIDVDIDLQLDEAIGEVPLIAEDFSRVILNLCTNAFDACAQRGSSENLPQSPGGSFESLPQSGSPRRVPPPYKPSLAIRTGKTNGTIAIEIEDNGPGIPDDIKDKILQPFFTTKKGTQGTGLGLSITNDIIKAHGGTLHISSSHGGSTFKIMINS